MDAKVLRAIKRRDRIARGIIISGGWMILISVIGILLLIAKVSLPLFYSPSINIHQQMTLVLPEGTVIEGVQTDEYLENAFVLSKKGEIFLIDLLQKKVIQTLFLEAPKPEISLLSLDFSTRENMIYGLWSNGQTTQDQILFETEFKNSIRSMKANLKRLGVLNPAQKKFETPPQHVFAGTDSAGQITQVEVYSNKNVQIVQHINTKNIMGKIKPKIYTWALPESPSHEVTAVTFDHEGRFLCLGTSDGELWWWELSKKGSAPKKMIQTKYSEGSITSLSFIFGDVSLLVGDASGSISACFPIRSTSEVENVETSTIKLEKVHQFASLNQPILTFSCSLRNKSFLTLAKNNTLSLSHLTTENQYFRWTSPEQILASQITPRGDGVVTFDAKNKLTVWKIDNPHPEVSIKTLFGKVHYEGYPQPEYVWQSSSGTDDFEPKFSLVPLIFGSIKGTFYAMIFAAPLAFFAAVYTSQFLNPNLKKVIKPMIEIMASIPSVVLGFLAALWFAPLVEKVLVPFFLSFLLVPLFGFLNILLWPILKERISFLRRIEYGYEFLLVAPGIFFGVFVAWFSGEACERFFFQGDVKQWLFQSLGIIYDQRNCIIIAFGLGLAVIPIIFTISEDAISNVPRSLTAASLALGGSRWQTLWRVILPSASSGIFAAMIIGFGRAIGETMIVLMATGNTPIMDWGPFNGMRTLSANIAVEIPEAPVHGTLYRILFLSAVLLFVLTFCLNTVAELVRHRLRKKYGRL